MQTQQSPDGHVYTRSNIGGRTAERINKFPRLVAAKNSAADARIAAPFADGADEGRHICLPKSVSHEPQRDRLSVKGRWYVRNVAPHVGRERAELDVRAGHPGAVLVRLDHCCLVGLTLTISCERQGAPAPAVRVRHHQSARKTRTRAGACQLDLRLVRRLLLHTYLPVLHPLRELAHPIR